MFICDQNNIIIAEIRCFNHGIELFKQTTTFSEETYDGSFNESGQDPLPCTTTSATSMDAIGKRVIVYGYIPYKLELVIPSKEALYSEAPAY